MLVALQRSTLEMADLFQGQLEEAMRRGYVAAFRLLGNRDESHDACQEAATRALSAASTFDRRQPFYPWFYRILRNHCLDRLKQRGRRAAPAGDLPPPRSAPAPSALDHLISSERSDAVAGAIATLAPEQREIIELRHFQDASYEEIAQILECPLGTVMSRLYRARRALRGKLLDDPRFAEEHSGGGVP